MEMWKQPEFYLSTFMAGTSRGALAAARESGINLVEFAFTEPDAMREGARLCGELGLYAMANDRERFTGLGSHGAPYTAASVAGITAEFSQMPQVIAYYLWDEVMDDAFAAAKELQDTFRRLDPARLPYCILYPSYGVYNWNSSPVQWEDSSYYRYVDDFLKIMDPAVLAFDYYPFCGRWAAISDVREHEWWRDMGLMRKKAAEYSKPFWYYYQAVDLPGNTAVNITQAQIRLQMMAGLAYGAKYLSSYNALDYLFDAAGNKTARFEEGMRDQRRALAIGRRLFRKQPSFLTHTGLKPETRVMFYLDELSASPLLESAPDNLIVSVFDEDTVLVVNKDFQHDMVGAITLKEPKEVSLFDPSAGEETPVGSRMKNIPLALEPGGGAVFVLR